MYETDPMPTNTVRAGLNRIEGPLTVEVLDTLSRAQDQANEIQHRLYQMRDRLVGSPPPSPAQAVGANKTEASHFKGAHSDRAAMLLATLAEIDSISTDLANRL